MALRWIATSVLEAEKNFRRLRGYTKMPVLVAYLRDRDAELDSGLDDAKLAA